MKLKLLSISLIILFASVVQGQKSHPRGSLSGPTTVASLPAAHDSNILYDVRDALSVTDCTVGGGTTRVVCKWNGTAYAVVGAGGGGGGITNSAGNTQVMISDGTNATGDADLTFVTDTLTVAKLSTLKMPSLFANGMIYTTGGDGSLNVSTGSTCINQVATGIAATAGPVCASVTNAMITNGTINLTTKVTGVLPVANFTTGTPDGTKFVRDDGVLATPPGSGDMVLASVQTVTGAKTFGTIGGAVDKFILAGSTSGSSVLNAAAVAGATTLTLQGTTGTIYSSGGTDVIVADGGTGLSSGTSGGILGYTASGTIASSVALTVNVLPKGGGAGATPTNSLLTDDGTTLTYAGTGGVAITSSVAGAVQLTEGTTPAAAAVNSIKLQAPVDVTTAYDLILPPASTTGFLLNTNAANVGTLSIIGSTGTNTVVRDTTPTINTPVIAGGLTASGSGANTFAGSTGTFLTSTGAVTVGPGAVGISGIPIFTAPVRSSGVAAYFTINIPADTSQTAATEAAGFKTVTATRQWATTGTVALQRENFFAGPTYTSASASQTFTDAFTLYVTPPIAGTNAIFTRGHTLGIVDATSAASSITGGLVVAATLGTAATSVGIGGGNINAGGSIVLGGVLTQTSASATAFESGPNGATNPVLRLVNSVASSATGISVTGRAAAAGVDITVISSGTNEDLNIVPKGTGSVNIGAAPDVGIARNAAGLLEVNSGVAGTLRDITTRNTNAATYTTATNCTDSAGAAACGSAAAGSVVIDAAATTVVVSTTAVTANSQIIPVFDSSLGTRLSVTCNTTVALPAITARTAATSFTITIAVAPVTNPACFSYTIVN